MTVAQFAGVGDKDGAIDLQSMVPTGADCSYTVFLSTLDAYGTMTATYMWLEDGGDTSTEKFWQDQESGEKAEGVTFLPGQALWVEGANEDQFIQTSGQVITSDVNVQLQEGSTMAGNPTPVIIDLQDIVASGDDCGYNVFISKLDPYGTMTATYMWLEDGGDTGTEKFWQDQESGEKADGIEVAPGEGLWIEAANSSQYAVFPGVEL